MNAPGFPVQFPANPVMPEVRLAQPWAPARRAQPALRPAPRPASSVHMASLGQGEAALVARGSDIAFSIVTGMAAVVSGIALIVNFGKGELGAAPVVRPGAPVVPGRRASAAKPAWYVVGGVISLLGMANIWSSINRASALQPPPSA